MLHLNFKLTFISIILHIAILLLPKIIIMPIVTEQEIVSSLKMDKFGHWANHLGKQFMSWLRITDINHIYDQYKHLQGLDFVNAVLEHLNIEVIISENDMKKIPKQGPFIIIANHPLGAIDGLIMLKILLTYHPLSMIMANFLLKKINPIAEHICAVNPFETRKETFSSTAGLRQALTQLQNGLPLGIFPAGEVSARRHKFVGPIYDKAWDMSAIKLIKKAKVPVVPMYFHARNSDLFYWLADINDNLRTARLPSEVIKSRNKRINVRIGYPICESIQNEVQNIKDYGDLLRTKTYLLKLAYKKSMPNPFEPYFPKKKMSEVLPYQSISDLENNISYLQNTDALLLTKGDYQVLFTKINAFPSIKLELGRLRELTFRAVGEGTHKALDLDDFDEYYHHLILWNYKEKEIVGAYRMGLGSEIYKNLGLKGFYISELFHLTGGMHELMKNCIEMGRAFIVRSYQQKPLPLFILWKGIVEVTKRYPQYKFLIGAASISSHYCLYSRSLLVEYLKTHHLDTLLSMDVAPKLSFKTVLKSNDKLLVKENDMKLIDKLIEEIEPEGLKVPILIKKYLIHNAKMLGFNVDIKFNQAIDALMYIRIDDIDKTKFE